MTTTTPTTRTSTTTFRRSPRRTAAVVLGTALLGTVVPTGAAYAMFPARTLAPTAVTTAAPTVVPCFIGHLEWQDAIAGPAPLCELLP